MYASKLRMIVVNKAQMIAKPFLAVNYLLPQKQTLHSGYYIISQVYMTFPHLAHIERTMLANTIQPHTFQSRPDKIRHRTSIRPVSARPLLRTISTQCGGAWGLRVHVRGKPGVVGCRRACVEGIMTGSEWCDEDIVTGAGSAVQADAVANPPLSTVRKHVSWGADFVFVSIDITTMDSYTKSTITKSNSSCPENCQNVHVWLTSRGRQSREKGQAPVAGEGETQNVNA
jgi:hypothetical protein